MIAGPLALDGEPRNQPQWRLIDTERHWLEQAWVRARRPKRCKLANSPPLRRALARKLRLNWSPDGFYHVSHESIYRSLFVQTRGVLKKELLAIFDRSGRSAALGGRVQMAIDEGKLRILSRSVSGRQRLKIGRCLVIGRAISCPVRGTR